MTQVVLQPTQGCLQALNPLEVLVGDAISKYIADRDISHYSEEIQRLQAPLRWIT
jgi:hypothetical protein